MGGIIGLIFLCVIVAAVCIVCCKKKTTGIIIQPTGASTMTSTSDFRFRSNFVTRVFFSCFFLYHFFILLLWQYIHGVEFLFKRYTFKTCIIKMTLCIIHFYRHSQTYSLNACFKQTNNQTEFTILQINYSLFRFITVFKMKEWI